uniref:Type II restriction enzyme n=1 Tax=Candidatus Endomicrobium sp. MdDo-005 TaxID=1837115 RepID=A0A1C9ZTD8_9BACT|nr:type II restriction enzyme [Candidatus Endomicrobium sp. MdDo-005]
MADIENIIRDYNTVIKVVDKNASEHESRAYGGVIRATKGKLQEHITEEIVKLAWSNLKGKANRLIINSNKVKLPIRESYINHLPNKKVKEYIKKHISQYYYGLSVDKHVFIDKTFIMGIECKAYTENAMIKRILIDFHLLKTLYPNISCYLFQLESQLSGDYAALPKIVYGSRSTHSIMSYFEDVELNIFTFLKGERKIDNPIHKNFKPLNRNVLEKAVKLMEDSLKKYL